LKEVSEQFIITPVTTQEPIMRLEVIKAYRGRENRDHGTHVIKVNESTVVRCTDCNIYFENKAQAEKYKCSECKVHQPQLAEAH
jgi:protein-arginine kinase activator protein McsA